jgi:hypothetical protein
MGLLRRLFGSGGGGPEDDRDDAAGAGDDTAAGAPTADEVDAEERARELEVLRGEQARLDELVLRQQRYADRSWVPPPQGGTRRSDDGESTPGEGR